MSKFVTISSEVLAADEKLAKYLRQADIKPAKKGGAFVGNYEVAPDEFRRYGIVLPKGGIIVPDAEPDKLREIVSEPERLRETEDIASIEGEIGERTEKATTRQETLKRLFVEAKGVFTRTNEEKSCFAGHSLANGKARYDEWIEPYYFLGQVEVTHEEYEWLNTFLGEIQVPDGFVRVANDTHDLLRILEMPGRNDVLVVEGKTGSRRGVWSYGEWFRGHPSKCEISFWHKGTARKLKSVTLNGKVQESNYVSISLWTDPRELAVRALHEAGMEKPAQEYVEALAEIYRRQLGK